MKRVHVAVMMVVIICVGWWTPVAADECDIAARLVHKIQGNEADANAIQNVLHQAQRYARHLDGGLARRLDCGRRMMKVLPLKIFWRKPLYCRRMTPEF